MNSIMSIVNRIAILISGMILPRFILQYYGSGTNGLVSSINQFLTVITFLDLGVGSVVQSALYKPLVDNDNNKISMVLSDAKNYFRRIAYILLVYIIGLVIFYPLMINESVDFLSTAFLIIALSISTFAQYYFGIVNELLLNADQKSFIQLETEIVVVVLNLIISIVLIVNGFSIQVVKLMSGLIYLIRPMYLTYYVNKHYDIDEDIEVVGNPLPQKWYGVGQHVAYSVQNSTDIVVLTIFSSLNNVSIYSVYYMVVQGIQLVISSLTVGLQSFFGNLLANNEISLLNSYFSKMEWLIHTAVTFLYGMTAVLIVPFVMLYTSGVNDVNYYVPVFAVFLVLARTLYSLRTPYQSLVFSANHYKQTQMSSYIEAGLNIILSLILVNYLGLVGVAIGTAVAMAYRLFYLIVYLSQNILYRPVKIFIKQIFVDILMFSGIFSIGYLVQSYVPVTSVANWLIVAVLLGVIALIVELIINYLFYRQNIYYLFSRVFRGRRINK